jgi:hypothetical protein
MNAYPFRFRTEFDALVFMQDLSDGRIRFDPVLHPFTLDEGKLVPNLDYADAPYELGNVKL